MCANFLSEHHFIWDFIICSAQRQHVGACQHWALYRLCLIMHMTHICMRRKLFNRHSHYSLIFFSVIISLNISLHLLISLIGSGFATQQIPEVLNLPLDCTKALIGLRNNMCNNKTDVFSLLS